MFFWRSRVETMDFYSCETLKLISTIREKGARLSVPDVVDLSSITENTITENTQGVAKIVLEAVQDMKKQKHKNGN